MEGGKKNWNLKREKVALKKYPAHSCGGMKEIEREKTGKANLTVKKNGPGLKPALNGS